MPAWSPPGSPGVGRSFAWSSPRASSPQESLMPLIDAEPYEFAFDPEAAALLIIDMQRDFLEPGGFGESLGNDVSLLRRTIAPIGRLLDAARTVGLPVIHTREGHRPDLADLAPAKKVRGKPADRKSTRLNSSHGYNSYAVFCLQK